MKEHIIYNKNRLNRFEVEPLKNLKGSLERDSMLEEQLKADFKGVIEAEGGVVVDDTLKQQICQRWQSMIQEDVRRVMDEQPEDNRQLYTMVKEGKPLKVKVKIDLTTGERSIEYGVRR